MYKFSTTVPKSSDLPVRPTSAGTPDPQAGAPGLLNVLREYVCGVLPSRVAQRTQVWRFRRFVTRTYA